MKTVTYNPSPLEVEFAKAFHAVSEHIESKLENVSIERIECDLEADNPFVKFFLTDQDNDPHEIVMKIIQLPDKF